MTTASQQFALGDEQLELRGVIRQLVDRHVRPRAAAIDATGEFPDDVRQVLAEHDLFGLPFEVRDGGLGTGALMLCVAIEEIAKACASCALMLAVQDLGTLPIRLAGAPELRDRVLPQFASGDWLAAFALSEPDAGSDPGALRTRAERVAGGWRLDGVKN
jgi:alkylation response protein AidB-like acyl-CoA dehydrogenase